MGMKDEDEQRSRLQGDQDIDWTMLTIAAAAARINAAIQAKKGIQQADVPPIQKVRDIPDSRHDLTIDRKPAGGKGAPNAGTVSASVRHQSERGGGRG